VRSVIKILVEKREGARIESILVSGLRVENELLVKALRKPPLVGEVLGRGGLSDGLLSVKSCKHHCEFFLDGGRILDIIAVDTQRLAFHQSVPGCDANRVIYFSSLAMTWNHDRLTFEAEGPRLLFG
jgi:hypothetical protein